MKVNLRITLFVLQLFVAFMLKAAEPPVVKYNLFVLGNLAELKVNDPFFDRLDQLIEEQSGEVIVLLAGDFLDDNGLDLTPSEQEKEKLNRLLQIGNESTQLLFLPGDREWDNAGKKGLKKVKFLEEYLVNNGGQRHHFLTEKGCPGPEVFDVGDHLRILALNTHWFVHDHRRPEEEDADCDLLNESELWEELEDLVQSDGDRNVVIAAHHPALSYGRYAGYRQVAQHFLPPVVGTFMAAYHQNIGNYKDLSCQGMDTYSGRFESLLERFHGLIYVSGHEYDIQVNSREDNYHITSGSAAKKLPSAKGEFSKYRHPASGIVQLRFFDDGQVDMLVHEQREKQSAFLEAHQRNLYSSPCKPASEKDQTPANEQFLPCKNLLYPSAVESTVQMGKTSAIAGKEYKKGFPHRLFIGRHYRKAWTTVVDQIPYLDLDTTCGGLTAYAKGGAAQTRSVRFKSGDGQVFAFRSVNKDPTQKKGKDLASGLVGDIFKDITSSQHPYAVKILNGLMKEADIPNPEGKLFVLPDHPRLGPYREEFKGMLGWLERRPKSRKPGRKIYRNADKVTSTAKMNKMLYKDHDHQMDLPAYLQARLFDMWVADWDRHGKNWSWLGYGDKKKMTFYPFAKDRDKALTRMDGLFRVLDFPMISRDMYRFRKTYRGLKSLNFKSRNMDRQHLVTYTLEDLLAATKSFQKLMTDEVIEASVRNLPEEVYAFDGPEIEKVLKIRRDKMQDLMRSYYKLLSRKVHFIGSNKLEQFEVKRLPNGDVEVAMYKLKKNGERGDLLKKRICKKSETREIQLFGLGGADKYYIEGAARKSILVRIIGGNGTDEIQDASIVKGGGKKTKVYDYKEKDTLQLGQEGKLVKIPEEINFKMDGFYRDNHYLVVPFIAYNVDDGFMFFFGGQTENQKFNKPGFGSRYNWNFQATSRGKFNLGTSADFRHVFGKWDLSAGLSAGKPDFLFPQFFGLGNELVISDSLNRLDYYNNEMVSAKVNMGLSRMFWKKSVFSVEMMAEYHDVRPDARTENGESVYDLFPDDIETTLVGPRMRLDLDFRDSPTFPTKGVHFVLTDYTFLNSNVDWEIGGRVQADLSSFWSLGAKMPLTLSLKGGVSHSYGAAPFYYQSFLGQTSHLRGYRKNRFSGNTATYFNSELRWHIGRIQTRVAPFYWGIFGFYDVGRTYLEGENSNTFHNAYGGGAYLIPYNMKSFNLVMTIARSEEEVALLKFGVGFFIR